MKELRFVCVHIISHLTYDFWEGIEFETVPVYSADIEWVFGVHHFLLQLSVFLDCVVIHVHFHVLLCVNPYHWPSQVFLTIQYKL